MGTYVTDTGFIKKTLAEIKLELETDFQGVFGSDIDLDSSGSFGQLIGILAKRNADLWDLAEEIYNSRNVQLASGLALDGIVLENGITRLAALPTKVHDVILFGTEGTFIDITTAKKARQVETLKEYTLDASVTITKNTARYGYISVGTVTVGNTYIVTINAVNYSYLAPGGATKSSILAALKALIDAGSWVGDTALTDPEVLEIYDLDTDFVFSVDALLTIDKVGVGSDFTCTENGANTLAANTLIEIVTPVSGWLSINNYSAGTVGRATETDDELRIRREFAIQQGNATEDSIREAILNDVDSVISCTITSNRTDSTDIEGRPPHSFECVVVGGTDAAVAQKIWDEMPSGIATYGNTYYDITDSQGFLQRIYFSRAVNQYIHVKVKRSLYTEEEYPATGDDLIKAAILAWSLLSSNITIGKDVILQRLSIPVYSVPGIKDIEITADATDNPGDTPSYSSSNITITARQIAVFATSRIVVEVLP